MKVYGLLHICSVFGLLAGQDATGYMFSPCLFDWVKSGWFLLCFLGIQSDVWGRVYILNVGCKLMLICICSDTQIWWFGLNLLLDS
jgi:hypothetical protein